MLLLGLAISLASVTALFANDRRLAFAGFTVLICLAAFVGWLSQARPLFYPVLVLSWLIVSISYAYVMTRARDLQITHQKKRATRVTLFATVTIASVFGAIFVAIANPRSNLEWGIITQNLYVDSTVWLAVVGLLAFAGGYRRAR